MTLDELGVALAESQSRGYTKVTSLTYANVRALQLAQEEYGLELIATTNTTATFPRDANRTYVELGLIRAQIAKRYGYGKHTPAARLDSVLRKLDRLASKEN